MLTVQFKVCPTILLEAMHCMPPIFEGVASKVWPGSVTLNLNGRFFQESMSQNPRKAYEKPATIVGWRCKGALKQLEREQTNRQTHNTTTKVQKFMKALRGAQKI